MVICHTNVAVYHTIVEVQHTAFEVYHITVESYHDSLAFITSTVEVSHSSSNLSGEFVVCRVVEF